MCLILNITLYTARKGIFHGYRYLVFTEQIFAHGRITDYSAANAFLKEVLLCVMFLVCFA
jgi:hypothetical protein